MNAFFKNILATVIAAAIVANVAMLFNLNERLARIEAQMQLLVVEKGLVSR
jgi:hypothetical protein